MYSFIHSSKKQTKKQQQQQHKKEYYTDNRNQPEKEWDKDNLFNPTPLFVCLFVYFSFFLFIYIFYDTCFLPEMSYEI